MYSSDAAAVRARQHADRALLAIRIVGLSLFAVWTAAYMRDTEPLMHGSLLIFHEAGHVLFMPFGEFMMVLGGSLFQLMVPAFFVGYFLYRRDRFSACAAGLYLAASMAGVALYIADARAGELPLLGGDRTSHDWTFLLIEMKLLKHDVRIGGYVKDLAVITFWTSYFAGLWFALTLAARPAPDAALETHGRERGR
jgi:hypothetical protein